MPSVIAAYTVAWSVLMIFLLTLAARQHKLQAGLAALETLRRQADAAGPDRTAHHVR